MRHLIIRAITFLIALGTAPLQLEAIKSDDFLTERLLLLKSKGYEPKVIFDIGAYRGLWAVQVKKVFNDAEFYLFEANKENESYLKNLPFKYFLNILGDRQSEAIFYSNNSTGDSLFKEQTQFYQDGKCIEKRLQMTTLSNIVQDNNLPLPNLIKMDVQGAEKLIINGSPKVVANADVVILEAKILEYNKGAPSIYETMTIMDELGFCLLDITELHYLPTQELNEVDLLFVKKNSPLIKKGILW